MSALRPYSVPSPPLTSTSAVRVERGRGGAGVRDLDEPARVGADLVVVDLVDHEPRVARWRRRTGAGLAGEHDQIGRRAPTSTWPAAPSNVLHGVPASASIERDPRPGITLRARGPCRARRACRAGRPLDVPRDVGLVALAGVGAEDDADEAVPGVAARLDRRRGVSGRGRQRGGADQHRGRSPGERDRVSIHGRSSFGSVGRPTEVSTRRRAAQWPFRTGRADEPLLQAVLWMLRDARVTSASSIAEPQRFQGASASASMP